MRSDVAVKVFGDDLDALKAAAEDIARIARGVRGMRDMRVERVGGQQYLNIVIDRQAIARHGLNVADVQDVIETAVGGKVATEIYEGERRFQAVVRCPSGCAIRSTRSAPSPLTAPARRAGAARSLAEDPGERRPGAGQPRDGEAPHRGRHQRRGPRPRRLRRRTAAAHRREVKLPAGYYLVWGGQFQNMERALGHLMIIVPVTIAAIFFLLFLLFNSLRLATLIITVLPFASIGGVIALPAGEYLSVPASVGFIALWGIAVLNGVVLVTYIRKLREDGMERRAPWSRARRSASGR